MNTYQSVQTGLLWTHVISLGEKTTFEISVYETIPKWTIAPMNTYQSVQTGLLWTHVISLGEKTTC